ncbi:MAG: homoserine kinase [Anaerolineae bacterium]|nr:homoserine kinase [Anaerolineae bacterium]
MIITVRVPATTANLGPGFDCLALALDLWNETVIEVGGNAVDLTIRGEGAQHLPTTQSNLIIRAMKKFLASTNHPFPSGLSITCNNQIPTSSGLGSSSTAVLAGILAGNALIQRPLAQDVLLRMAARLEGHPDNVAGALLGGLVLVGQDDQRVRARNIPLPQLNWKVVVILPDFRLSTQDARAVLPQKIGLDQAVYNLSRASFVQEAFRAGDLDLLRWAMHDRLHQPQRLRLIPGAMSALFAAEKLGAAAALSGAGPSLVAFCDHAQDEIIAAMTDAFQNAGLGSRHFILDISRLGASVAVR